MEIISDILCQGAIDTWGISLTEQQLSQYLLYAEMLIEWNASRMNLTRITAPKDIAVKHFLDSLSLLKVCEMPIGSRMIDIGTGAGFPGLALKIARPDLEMTLIDGTAKKITFCSAVVQELGIAGVECRHGRAEELAKETSFQSCYSFALSRAVAALETIFEYSVPFIHPGGSVIAMKGQNIGNELPAAKSAARKLGLQLSLPRSIHLPQSDPPIVREIMVARKLP